MHCLYSVQTKGTELWSHVPVTVQFNGCNCVNNQCYEFIWHYDKMCNVTISWHPLPCVRIVTNLITPFPPRNANAIYGRPLKIRIWHVWRKHVKNAVHTYQIRSVHILAISVYISFHPSPRFISSILSLSSPSPISMLSVPSPRFISSILSLSSPSHRHYCPRQWWSCQNGVWAGVS